MTQTSAAARQTAGQAGAIRASSWSEGSRNRYHFAARNAAAWWKKIPTPDARATVSTTR